MYTGLGWVEWVFFVTSSAILIVAELYVMNDNALVDLHVCILDWGGWSGYFSSLLLPY